MRPSKGVRQAAQFLANFSAWCKYCHAPAVEITGSLPDRCEFKWTDEWQKFCERQMVRQDIGITAHHNFPGVSLEGYRDKKYSIAGAQVIKRVVLDGHVLHGEADFDWGVPIDVVGLLIHFFRDYLPNKLKGKRMNQFKLARYFRR